MNTHLSTRYLAYTVFTNHPRRLQEDLTALSRDTSHGAVLDVAFAIVANHQ